MTYEENEAVSWYRIDCFVAPTIILKPKAARDKGVETVLCIDTSNRCKSVRLTRGYSSMWLFALECVFLGVVLFTGTLTHSMGSRLIRQFFFFFLRLRGKNVEKRGLSDTKGLISLRIHLERQGSRHHAQYFSIREYLSENYFLRIMKITNWISGERRSTYLRCPNLILTQIFAIYLAEI